MDPERHLRHGQQTKIKDLLEKPGNGCSGNKDMSSQYRNLLYRAFLQYYVFYSIADNKKLNKNVSLYLLQALRQPSIFYSADFQKYPELKVPSFLRDTCYIVAKPEELCKTLASTKCRYKINKVMNKIQPLNVCNIMYLYSKMKITPGLVAAPIIDKLQFWFCKTFSQANPCLSLIKRTELHRVIKNEPFLITQPQEAEAGLEFCRNLSNKLHCLLQVGKGRHQLYSLQDVSTPGT